MRRTGRRGILRAPAARIPSRLGGVRWQTLGLLLCQWAGWSMGRPCSQRAARRRCACESLNNHHLLSVCCFRFYSCRKESKKSPLVSASGSRDSLHCERIVICDKLAARLPLRAAGPQQMVAVGRRVPQCAARVLPVLYGSRRAPALRQSHSRRAHASGAAPYAASRMATT